MVSFLYLDKSVEHAGQSNKKKNSKAKQILLKLPFFLAPVRKTYFLHHEGLFLHPCPRMT